MPIRIQLSRRKGWRKPIGSIKVDRSTPWGNPYKVTPQLLALHHGDTIAATKSCIASFVDFLGDSEEGKDLVKRARRELRGHDLCCWCRLSAPCHADEWLRIANQ